MELSVVIVGTSGSVPTAGRGLPALLVRHGGQRILIDCGEGTQRQLVRSVGLVDLDKIFFTHFHADHWLGLPGLLKTLELRDRERPLEIYGPVGLQKVLDFTNQAVGATRFEVIATELQRDQLVASDGLNIAPVPVEHRGAALGYALYEDARPGRVDVEKAKELGVREGPDIGRLQAGESVNDVDPAQVIGPERIGRKLVVSGDTRPCEALALAAHEADVLIHEATFLDDEADRAAQKAHSTAAGAAQLARDAQVKLLVLTHLSSRYGGREVRDEARAVFECTKVARDFDLIEIPFPERGGPVYTRSSRDANSRKVGNTSDATSEASAIVEPQG